MDKIVNIRKIREDNINKIEERAYDLFGILKVKEDVYVHPEVAFVSNSSELKLFFNVELCGMRIEELLEKEAIDEINSIVPMQEQSIKILLHNKEDNMLTFDIVNVVLNKSILITTPMEFNKMNRKIFTAIVAGAIKKVGVDVTFLVQLNFEEIKRMVDNV